MTAQTNATLAAAQAVRVRIAPSPTGKMHVGTARTALFNYLFARRHKGAFLLRIEDTDKERNTPENVDYILQGLAFLGLSYDETAVYQSQNATQHAKAAALLLEKGLAYEDDGAVRFKIPAGHTVWDDLVQGTVEFQHQNIEDFVILRSDGTPTYHMAVVVDDIAMGITHIIRGDDHLNNTPKQILLHQALGVVGWDGASGMPPHFAHIPLVHGEDGHKLSKRHGAASVQDFAAAGFLPAALNHYFMMLSWLPGDEMAPLTLQSAAAKFDLKDVGSAAPRFDYAKLRALNSSYLKTMAAHNTLLDALVPFLPHTPNKTETQRLSRALPALAERAETLVELAQQAAFCFHRPTPDHEGDMILDDGLAHLKALHIQLNAMEDWRQETLEAAVKDYIAKSGAKFPAVGKPLRVALMGQPHGLGLGEMLFALGQQETLQRISDVIAQHKQR